MTMTERERRENKHRANLNNPNNPEFGKGFEQAGIPPQPAQVRAGEARPDRIDEGRGQASPRGRKPNGDAAPGTVLVETAPGYGASDSPLSDKEAGGIGGRRQSKERAEVENGDV
jgi:hypothetical protein